MARRLLRNFSPVLCSDSRMTDAFDSHGPTRLWWSLILRLHGKPRDPMLNEAERIACLSAGFRFYARLYRFLAGACYVAAVSILPWDASASSSGWCSGALILAGGLLWTAGGLGHAGAQRFQERSEDAVWLLVAFFILIVAFLSLFLGAVSMLVELRQIVSPWLNLTFLVPLFVVGIGSYMIEIVYLLVVELGPRRNVPGSAKLNRTP